MHLGSVAFIYWAFVQSDYLEFWGIKQAWRKVAEDAVEKPPIMLKKKAPTEARDHLLTGLAGAH